MTWEQIARRGGARRAAGLLADRYPVSPWEWRNTPSTFLVGLKAHRSEVDNQPGEGVRFMGMVYLQ